MTEQKEMMFVVYRKEPCRVFSIHRNYLSAAAVKDKLVEDGDDMKNIETLGLYVKE